MVMIHPLFLGHLTWIAFCLWASSSHCGVTATTTSHQTLRRGTRELQSNVSIELVRASTGSSVASLASTTDNLPIVIEDVSDLTIVVNAPSANYVKFILKQGDYRKHEGRAPFALCGDAANVLLACDFWQYDRSYNLEIKVSTGQTVDVSFQLVRETPPAPAKEIEETIPSKTPYIGYNLVDTSSSPQRVLIPNIQNGALVPIDRLAGAKQLTVSVIPSFEVGALKFDNNKVEARFPFSYCGDEAGVFRDCFPASVGSYGFTFNAISTSGTRISKETFQFRIVEGATDEEPEEVVVVDNPMADDLIVPRGRWQLRNGLPITARHEACFVWVNGKAYLIGGRRNPATDIYNPTTNRWTTGQSPPIQLHHMQCVVVGPEVWIVAAWTGGYPREKTPEDMYIYHTRTDTWRTKPGLPEDRRRGSAAVILANRRIYVSHGSRGGHATTAHVDVEVTGFLDYFDLDQDVWVTNLPDAPNPRDHTGGAFLNHRYICVAGGRNGSIVGWPMVAATDCYDTVTNRWTTQPSMPLPRSGSSYGTSCDGKWLLVAGGERGNSVFDSFHAFDGRIWRSLTPLRDARHGSSLAMDCTCDRIFLASGSGGPRGGPELSSMETLGTGC